MTYNVHGVIDNLDSHSWIIILSIVLLLGCSAFFSASETAISTFNKIRMKKNADSGSKAASLAMKLSENYDKTVTSILIGNNIVNILASSLATLMFTALLGATRGAVTATVVMTLLVLTFGEILPKSFGKEHNDVAAMRLSGVLTGIIWFLTPLSFVFLKLNGLAKKRGPAHEQAPSITEEELIYMMDAIEEEGVLEEQERDLVQSALEFDEISIREILTPRVNIVAVDVDSSIDEIKAVIVEERYSRVPVFEESIDNIIGVLYTRDFLLGLAEGREMKIRDMLGEPLFVHKGMKLSQLLAHFKAKKLNLAVVVDEYGGTMGIVTMEDVLEELVGEIWDEDDEIPLGFAFVDDDCFEVTGDFDVWEMFEALGIAEDEVECDYSTVNGWALHELAHIPAVGEELALLGYRFTILEMDGHRIKRLGIYRLPLEAEITEEKE